MNNDIENEKDICDACGSNMYDSQHKSALVGFELKFGDMAEPPHNESRRIMEMFGKNEFKICFPCWIKSLGVKPSGAVD